MNDAETRPYPNEHAARVRDPDDFSRIAQLKALDNGIRILGGPLKSDPKGGAQTQAYRFPKDKFTTAEAKKWLKDNDIKYVSFEPASEKSADDEHECRTMDACDMAIEERISADGESTLRHLVGYAAMFNKRTTIYPGFDEIIAPGAFGKSLDAKDDVRALFNHNPDHVLGRLSAGTVTLEEDDRGLKYDITLPDTQFARDLHVLVDRGDITGSSFAFRCIVDEWDKSNPKASLRTLREVQLFDVSPVTYPAYKQTKVSARAIQEVVDAVVADVADAEQKALEAMKKYWNRVRQRTLAAMLGIHRSQTEQDNPQ